jgi:DNA-binding transcriptional MerR regulator
VAEILIQRRRQRNVWPWLLGLLALALLPLPFMAGDRDDRRPSRSATSRRPAAARSDTAAAAADTARAPGAATEPRAAAGGPGARSSTSDARTTSGSARSGERTTQSAAGAVVSAPGAPSAAAGATGAPATRGAAAPVAEPTGAPAAASTPSSTSFERFIATSNPRANEREHREFTSDALRRLATELRALGASTAGVRAIMASSDSLRMTNTRGSADPDHARAAFLAAVREFDVLRGRYRAPVDTGALRAAAWAIRPDQRLVAQRTTVQRFFERARDALRALSRSRSSLRAPDRRSR